MVDGPMNFIIFYVTFFLLVSFIGGLAAGDLEVGASENISTVPSLSDMETDYTFLDYLSDVLHGFPEEEESNLTLADYITFGFSLVGYILGLQGLTILGIPSAYAAILAIILDIVMFYILVRLVRGGG